MRRSSLAAALVCAAMLACAGSASAASYGVDAHSVIVKFVPGTTAAQKTAVLGGLQITGTINGLGADVVRVASAPAATAAALDRSALVQYAEVNRILRASAIPNDTRFAELYGLNNTGQS